LHLATYPVNTKSNQKFSRTRLPFSLRFFFFFFPCLWADRPQAEKGKHTGKVPNVLVMVSCGNFQYSHRLVCPTLTCLLLSNGQVSNIDLAGKKAAPNVLSKNQVAKSCIFSTGGTTLVSRFGLTSKLVQLQFLNRNPTDEKRLQQTIEVFFSLPQLQKKKKHIQKIFRKLVYLRETFSKL